MATVTSNLTRINDLEGALSSVSIGGGAGAAASTDIFLQGAQSLARRQSNVTLGGFLLNDGATNDLSAADVHVGAWIWVTHYSVLTALRLRMAGAASGDYDEHIIPLTEYPSLGGWLRVWVDISRTPDATGGAALNEAAVQHFGPVISLPTVGGNAPNLVLDALDHTTTGLLLTGTAGVFQDFLDADEGNTTNKYGVVNSIFEIIYCRARLMLGSASSLVFTDSGFTLVFPQQNTVADTFMGLSIDLQNVSTDIELLNGAISSPGVKKGDFIVTGTTGSLLASGMAFSGLRAIALTTGCTVTGSSFSSCGQIDADGPTFTSNNVSGYTGATDTSALVWDVATDPNSKLDGCSFTKGAGTTHAIEFGLTSPTTMTLTDVNFSGYNASNGQNDSAIHIKRTTGTVTINISGGNSPSYKTDGATVVIVAGAVDVVVTVVDSTATAIENARVFIEGLGAPFPFNASVTITRSATTATVTHTGHGLSTNDKVVIRGANQQEYNGVKQITVIDANTYTFTVAGSPTTPATGTIVSTFVVIEGLTDNKGEISMTRVFPSSLAVTGTVRKASSAPYFKPAGIVGSVSSTAGLALTVQMISDD